MLDQNLTEYIKNSLNSGQSKETIYKELLNQGWSLAVIEEHFNPVTTETEAVEEKEESHKRTVFIIVTIGALLVGAGIFSFIASNWTTLSSAIKIVIILLGTILAHVAGWILKEKNGFAKTGEAMYLLGSILYGSGIFLVGQIFHIRANWPDGMILWMLGTLAMAFALDSYGLFYLAIPLGVVSIIGYPYLFWEILSPNAFLHTSVSLLLITTTVCFLTGRAMKKRMPPEIKDLY